MPSEPEAQVHTGGETGTKHITQFLHSIFKDASIRTATILLFFIIYWQISGKSLR